MFRIETYASLLNVHIMSPEGDKDVYTTICCCQILAKGHFGRFKMLYFLPVRKEVMV